MGKQSITNDLAALGGLLLRPGSMGRQLAARLREAIESGQLRPGDRLPASRLLARKLELARGTVADVFSQLVAEGYLESRVGAGTYVARDLGRLPIAAGPQRLLHRHAGDALPNWPQAEPPFRFPKQLETAQADMPPNAGRFAAFAERFAPQPLRPFSVAVPLAGIAPDQNWRRLGNRVRASMEAAPTGYEDPCGLRELCEAIAAYVRKSRAVVCEPENVVITNGAQQGLYITGRILLGPGEPAWAENPAYPGLMTVLEDVQARVFRIPVDGQGVDVSAGAVQCPDARAAFVTPSHQFPLGMVMSMPRRMELLAWARTCGAWIVEDDYDSELRFSGQPFPSLQGLDPQRVIYLGTMSKVLFPSLRIGYAIVPQRLVGAFAGARALMDKQSPTAEQHVLAAYMREGYFEAHVRRIRKLYAQRRQILLDLLQARLANWGSPQPGEQGMHLIFWLAPHVDDVALALAASRQGLAVRPVSPLYGKGTGRPGLMLGFGGFSEQQLEEGVETLLQLFERHCQRV